MNTSKSLSKPSVLFCNFCLFCQMEKEENNRGRERGPPAGRPICTKGPTSLSLITLTSPDSLARLSQSRHTHTYARKRRARSPLPARCASRSGDMRHRPPPCSGAPQPRRTSLLPLLPFLYLRRLLSPPPYFSGVPSLFPCSTDLFAIDSRVPSLLSRFIRSLPYISGIHSSPFAN